MTKLTLATLAAVVAFGGQALAASELWLVTEENTGGVKGAQGSWTVTVDGSKVTGVASMQSGNGSLLNYKVEGTAEGGIYTLNMIDRTDGKKGCVWSGHTPSSSSTQKTGLIGYAECEGAKLIVRASFVGH